MGDHGRDAVMMMQWNSVRHFVRTGNCPTVIMMVLWVVHPRNDAAQIRRVCGGDGFRSSKVALC